LYNAIPSSHVVFLGPESSSSFSSPAKYPDWLWFLRINISWLHEALKPMGYEQCPVCRLEYVPVEPEDSRSSKTFACQSVAEKRAESLSVSEFFADLQQLIGDWWVEWGHNGFWDIVLETATRPAAAISNNSPTRRHRRVNLTFQSCPSWQNVMKSAFSRNRDTSNVYWSGMFMLFSNADVDLMKLTRSAVLTTTTPRI